MPRLDAAENARAPTSLAAKLGLAVGLTLALGVGGAEMLWRLYPDTIPMAYRVTLPLRGLELEHPGIMARTRIDEVPIPHFLAGRTLTGPPPQDLKGLGVAPASDVTDVSRLPSVMTRIDALGFPNPGPFDRADVFLVGDSFTATTGVQEPPGLVSVLSRDHGLRVFNAGIGGSGPQQHAWLVRTFAPRLKPRAVVWLFFGGNDIFDAARILKRQESGIETFADLHPRFSRPRFYGLAVARFFLASSGSRPPRSELAQRPEAVPGIPFPPGVEGSLIWFHPDYLDRMTRSEPEWVGDPGFGATRSALGATADFAGQRGWAFAVVYVPTKPQVYLRLLEPWKDRALAMANFGSREPREDATAFFQSAIDHADSLERLLKGTCEEEGIAFLSATHGLRELADRGELGYLATDTHWTPVGQLTLLRPLLEWLDREGV